jgi:hypothetical protein
MKIRCLSDISYETVLKIQSDCARASTYAHTLREIPQQPQEITSEPAVRTAKASWFAGTPAAHESLRWLFLR